MRKKAISLLLTVCMLLSVLPTFVFAANDPFTLSAGTDNAPLTLTEEVGKKVTFAKTFEEDIFGFNPLEGEETESFYTAVYPEGTSSIKVTLASGNGSVYTAAGRCVASTGGSSTMTFTLDKTVEYYVVTSVDEDSYYGLTLKEEAAKRVDYIASLYLSTTMNKAEMAVKDADGSYTLAVPDSIRTIYAWAELADNAPAGSSIQLVYFNGYKNQESTLTFRSGGRLNVPYACVYGMEEATATLRVVKGGEVLQSETVKFTRVPTLESLSLAETSLNESFSASKLAYTAVSTLAESVTVNAAGYDESYTITYNGSESNVVPLTMGENTIEVAVTAQDVTQTYTIQVLRTRPVHVSFDVTPADAVVNLTDGQGMRILPDDDGVYTIKAGEDYTCVVTLAGYVGQKSTVNVSEDGTFEVTLDKAPAGSTDPTIPAEWPNFRNGDNHLGITSAKTPYDPEDAELLWAVKYGSGWAAAPGSPILVDDCIVTYSGKAIRKLDKNTGALVAEGEMVASSSYSIVPPTYADGMIFIGLSGGRIQCFDAKTLESLWVYTDPLGGQPNCPITYKNGYVYAGFWNSENRVANFACLSVTDEDPSQSTEAKLATWTYSRMGGFYWAGAYASANGKYIVVGTDDGERGYNTEAASLLVFESVSGKLVDSWDGIRGDIRSNVSYDPQSGRVFFTSKGGVLCNARIDWNTGAISDEHTTVIKNSKGTEYAMSTCTPSVYNGRIYIGVSGDSQFGASSGHGIAVYSLEGDGTMTQAYVYDIVGYPQTSAMVSVGYVTDEDDSVYIYLPYNYTPGGISVLKDKPGQTQPVTTTGEGYSEVFTPSSPLAQYCICSTIADSTGTIYYKNDSCYMMAISSKLLRLAPSTNLRFEVDEEGNVTVTRGHVWAKLKNGEKRDVSAYLTWDAETEELVYTYGFDSANYGLKELRLKIKEEETPDIVPPMPSKPDQPTQPDKPTQPDHNLVCPSHAYLDVDTTLWYHEAVDFVMNQGLMSGVSDTTFAPNGNMTRGMLVTVLYRLAGSPESGSGTAFADVSAADWYAKAVAWAGENGIAKGLSEDRFGANVSVTREQIVTMLYRYSVYQKYTLAAGADLSSFSDSDQIGAYALEALSWAVAQGLLQGRDGSRLAPTATATRVEVATMLQRYSQALSAK